MRQQVLAVTCDFCGYGGPLSRPEDFVPFGGVDLCRWCAAPMGPPAGRMECGKHVIEIADDDWTCSCGESRAAFEARDPTRVSGSVLVRAVVPDLAHATARVHSEEWA